jgi:Tfp pilus assembly protein FimT
MVVLAVTLVLIIVAIPSLRNTVQVHRLTISARGIASQLSLARMRALADFTRARLTFDLAANTYKLEVWNKGANAYQVEGGTLPMAQAVTFGYGSITTPAGGQTTNLNAQPITINSRAIPVDSSGNPTNASAVYLGDNLGRYVAITVRVSGQIKVWQYNVASWVAY